MHCLDGEWFMVIRLSKKIALSWQSGTIIELRPAERPETLGDAEAVQDRVIAELSLMASAWKLGASNRASRESLGLPRPFSGLLPADRVFASGAVVDVSQWRHRGVECELAVSLLRDIEPDYGRKMVRADVLALLGPVHPALEIPDTRFKTLATTEGPMALVADNGASGRAVIGAASACGLDAVDSSLEARLSFNGSSVESGDMKALIADPVDLVTDHVNRMCARGYCLRKGEFILLGSLTPYFGITADGRIRADFGDIGMVEIEYVGTNKAV